MLEQLEELKLDLIEIMNPIGDVLEEVENKFAEFERRNSDIIIVCRNLIKKNK